MFDILVVGCGLSGIVVARTLAEQGRKVHIVERRNHIGGNIYDYVHETGVVVQKYGPHVFFTDNENIEKYINRFSETSPFYPECRTMIGEKAIPIPFNFASIDMIYSNEDASSLKKALIEEFGANSIVSVLDVINSQKNAVHEYGMYMYDHEYKKYSAKQWGIPIESIKPEVFMRVPVYISYKKPYLKKKYQYLPGDTSKYVSQGGFYRLAQKMLAHPNISLELETDALDFLRIDEQHVSYKSFHGNIVYTGSLDALFAFKYGKLPYRSLEFTWKVIPKRETIETPLCAFPEADKYIRITDYTQFPRQCCGNRAVIAIEYPLEYKADELCGNEPYYPTLTEGSKEQFLKYKNLAKGIKNLFPCGRLADFKYYNMDEVILRAFEVTNHILQFKQVIKI